MTVSVLIGNIHFESKEAAIRHCQAILHKDAPNTEIVGEDAVFVEAILRARPDKLAELRNRKIIRYVRKIHRHNTLCFFAVLDDNSLLDISFMKMINSYPHSTA